MPRVADILEREYNLGLISDREIPSLAVSATTSDEILRVDPNRLALTIINTGSFAVMVRPIGSASTTNGILLAANGGGISLFYREDYVLTTRRWTAIAIGTASTLYVLEQTSIT